MKTLMTTAAALSLCAGPLFAADSAEVLDTYADIAQAGYEDSLTTAKALQEAIDALIADPSQETLDAAREA